MNSIKLLTFGWEYAPIVTGGLGVVCRDLSKSLAAQGVDVSFVLPKLPKQVSVDYLDIINASEIEITEQTVKHIQVDTLLTPYASYDVYNKQLTALKKRLDLSEDAGSLYGYDLFNEIERYAARAYDIAKEVNPDVIHAHDWMTFKAGINAKRATGKPLITHIHATEYDRSGGNPYMEIVNYERMGMVYADRVFAVSEKTKNTIVEQYMIPEDKITVIHNAVPYNGERASTVVPADKKEKIVLFLGRMSVQKGADYLLKAAEKVLKIHKDVKFVFVGAGDMLKYLIDMSIDLGISQNVVFTGYMSHEEVDKAYHYADLFVMPSVSEPFGITSLEAIRNGTPVLMSKQSGASEVVSNALKVDFWDTEEMANKILAVLMHESLAETLIDNGYSDLERLSWDKQAKKVIDIYKELIQK
ncbi:glycosyltransferase family 4 protein [Candidatus Dojkabacteria bacterium]|uniref:starch synthase n=1 Tax=Candidatus Dojkabacteria bacterium TaxID=2099670 RepID=A0A955L4A6_9BACT|nr:glycosyltransferase family 4 protein [Candidatus Dojkabacteria bacterium]